MKQPRKQYKVDQRKYIECFYCKGRVRVQCIHDFHQQTNAQVVNKGIVRRVNDPPSYYPDNYRESNAHAEKENYIHVIVEMNQVCKEKVDYWSTGCPWQHWPYSSP